MCAEIYHCADFITSDPVQFPHRYTLKQDIEISGLLTAIMSFGNRKQILKKADELHSPFPVFRFKEAARARPCCPRWPRRRRCP